MNIEITEDNLKKLEKIKEDYCFKSTDEALEIILAFIDKGGEWVYKWYTQCPDYRR